MTRKDFELIAGALRTARIGSPDKVGVDIAIQNIAWSLSATHPRFNQELFLVSAHHMKEERDAKIANLRETLAVN